MITAKDIKNIETLLNAALQKGLIENYSAVVEYAGIIYRMNQVVNYKNKSDGNSNEKSSKEKSSKEITG